MEAFVLIAFGILSIVGTMFMGLVLLFGLFYETSRMNQKA